MKYAALEEVSVTIPGDERSRTNPGHGYPEHTEHYIRVREFSSKEEMQDWVSRHQRGYMPSKYRLIQYEELQATTTVEVSVSLAQAKGGDDAE